MCRSSCCAATARAMATLAWCKASTSASTASPPACATAVDMERGPPGPHHDHERTGRSALRQDSRLAERGDAVDVADEQHALFVDRRIAQAVGRRVAGVLAPGLVELAGDTLAARIGLALF